MIEIKAHIEPWDLKTPFRISRGEYSTSDCLVVQLTSGDHVGYGEAQGVGYAGETPQGILEQALSLTADLRNGLSRRELQERLPPGGARNAIDCAFWDLEAKQSGKSIWELTGIEPRTVTTVFTIGLEDTAESMAQKALDAGQYPILKVKLGNDRPLERLRAIQKARPDAKLVIDINQAWSFAELESMVPEYAKYGVTMIEQPLPRDADDELESFKSPIPLAADESCKDREDLAQAAQRYDIINIKLDKTGGLTEALELAREAQSLGCKLMVGNNVGTSLSMAPAFVIAQFCDYVDIDGPLLLKSDRPNGMRYRDAEVDVFSPKLWG